MEIRAAAETVVGFILALSSKVIPPVIGVKVTSASNLETILPVASLM